MTSSGASRPVRRQPKDSGTTRWSASFIKSATASVGSRSTSSTTGICLSRAARTTSIDPCGAEVASTSRAEAFARAASMVA